MSRTCANGDESTPITTTITIITYDDVGDVEPALAGGSSNAIKYIRGQNSSHDVANPNGDFAIEQAEDDGNDNELAFHVRYIPHTDAGTYNVGNLRAAILAERAFSSIYTANTILPFPNEVKESTEDPNHFSDTTLMRLSSDISVFQGLDGIDMVQDTTPRIAGPEGDYVADTGLIDTGARITGYFNGQAGRGAYTIGSVTLDGSATADPPTGTALQKTARAIATVPADSTSFVVETSDNVNTTKYYEVVCEMRRSEDRFSRPTLLFDLSKLRVLRPVHHDTLRGRRRWVCYSGHQQHERSRYKRGYHSSNFGDRSLRYHLLREEPRDVRVIEPT